MALVYMDGFEVDNSLVLPTNESAVAARVTYQAFGLNGSYQTAQPTVGNSRCIAQNNAGSIWSLTFTTPKTDLFIGVAYQTNVMTAGKVMSLNEQYNVYSPTKGISVELLANGSLAVKNLATSATLFTTAINIIQIGVWFYIELGVSFGASTTITLKVDNVTVGSASSVDSRGGLAAAGYTNLSFYANGATAYYDDLYVADSSGTLNNTFLGPVSVYTLVPNAAGSSTQLTPSAGSNWDCVNEYTADASYVKSTATNQVDLFNVENLPTSPTSIFGVIVNNVSLKNDNGTRKVRNKIKSGATTGDGVSSTLLFNANRITSDVFELQPDGSTAWDAAAINAVEIGIESV